MKAVLDTNILVSAFITDGLCTKLLRRANRGEFELILCPRILEEFQRALKTKVGASPTEIIEAVSLLAQVGKLAGGDTPDPPRVCRDRDDDHVLECASARRADYLVSGDRDLLSLGKHKGVRIVSPRDFELLF